MARVTYLSSSFDCVSRARRLRPGCRRARRRVGRAELCDRFLLFATSSALIETETLRALRSKTGHARIDLSPTAKRSRTLVGAVASELGAADEACRSVPAIFTSMPVLLHFQHFAGHDAALADVAALFGGLGGKRIAADLLDAERDALHLSTSTSRTCAFTPCRPSCTLRSPARPDASSRDRRDGPCRPHRLRGR